MWLKNKQEGLRRFWSMFPLTRVPFWYRLFEPLPFSFGQLDSISVAPGAWPITFPRPRARRSRRRPRRKGDFSRVRSGPWGVWSWGVLLESCFVLWALSSFPHRWKDKGMHLFFGCPELFNTQLVAQREASEAWTAWEPMPLG